jgi:hypothetical protein
MLNFMSQIRQLIDEHEAQRMHIDWLEHSIDAIIPKRSKEYTPGDLKKIKADIRSLDNALYYLREGYLAHWQRDEMAIHDLINEPMIRQFDEWHNLILLQLDKVIMQVDLVNSEKWNTEEMISFLEKIRVSIHTFHQMVVEHIREEDVILQKALTSVIA